MTITDISAAKLFRDVKFVRKINTLAEYREEIARYDDIEASRCLVTHVVALSAAEYDDFINHLLTDRDWLSGKGGTGSSASVPQVNSFFDLTPEQQELFRQEAYRLAIAVSCPGSAERPTLYADPQGYAYPRYVGL